MPAFNLSAVIAQMSQGGLGNFPGADAVSLAVSSSGMLGSPVDPSRCAYGSAAGSFVCPSFTVGGATHAISFWLYDANGGELTSLDATGVASVRLVADMNGSTTYPDGSIDASSGHSDLTMSGLLTQNRMLMGSASAHGEDTITGDPIHRTSDMKSSTSLVIPAGSGLLFPAVGTIALNFNSAGAPGVAVHQTLTFDGSGFVMLASTVPGSSSTSRCRVELSTGNESC